MRCFSFFLLFESNATLLPRVPSHSGHNEELSRQLDVLHIDIALKLHRDHEVLRKERETNHLTIFPELRRPGVIVHRDDSNLLNKYCVKNRVALLLSIKAMEEPL